ncbi:NnrU family protein [Rhizobium sp. LjRoot30]|uniref:NnrU family protein n=1 Tax=Rhizobium sp. LjRoot30 TaxID=3342320 RepID=UPI003ECEFFCC
MIGLFAAFILFVALHSVPAIPAIRTRIIGRVGRPAYLAGYSTVSTALLVWLFYEALNTDYIELWATAAWQVSVTFILAPLGLFFVIAGLISPNPFSVSLRQDGHSQGAIVNITRHPVLWGFVFWAAGHVLPNGDLRSLILFGGFAVFAVGGLAMTERRARTKFRAEWPAIAKGSSVVPFLAISRRQQPFRIDGPMLVGAIGAALISLWLLYGGHAALVGADPLATLHSLP